MDREKIVKEFRRIKKLGFLPSKRSHNTGIGKTFEDYLGVNENNRKDPDFAGFEVKSQRQASKSYITLFTKSPSHPSGANAYLREAYGKPDAKFPKIKVLHTSFFGDKFNTYLNRFGFRLKVSRNRDQVVILVKSIQNDKLLEDSLFWTFADLKLCIESKLKGLFVVLAEAKKTSGIEHFHYTQATVYNNLQFDKFLKALESGAIMFDVRIGAYKTPGSPSFGKTHDHGSGFRIKRENLPSIFEQVFRVE